jgi:hypothetical protein
MSRVRPRSFARLTCALAMPAIVGLASACQDHSAELATGPRRIAAADASATASAGPTAAVTLSTASAALTQTGTTAWTLAKTGAVNTTTKTVTWTITATKGTTTAGQLVVSGLMAVTNTGTAGATIGNVVVTLQQKSGASWTSLSADVADATHGDAATTAHIDPKASSENLATITENTASGALQFLDAHANTLFALEPEQTIAPGATVTLLFSARFDNTVLKLPAGQAVRAEVIVSFGHSTANKPSAENVDINGNGVIDADEAWVRSVPTRLGLTVPAQQADNSTLTINDVASNITATGDVTFSNPTFNLGTTSGTVTVSYNGGANGGKITNCATGTGAGTTVNVGGFVFPVDGNVGLQACNTQDIGATPTCTAGTLGCGWSDGNMTTYVQSEWGGHTPSTTAKSLLEADFNTVYAATFGVLRVGGGFTMSFDGPPAVEAYLPQTASPGALDATLDDPTTSASGAFGGEVVTLKLNVDFSDAGFITGTAGLKFGDLTICNSGVTALNGASVRQFLAAANQLLGGGTSTYGTISDLQPIAFNLNGAFLDGSPSTFAQTSLVNGTSCGWNNGDFTTYDESAWGDPSTVAAANLNTNFNTVYASLGAVEVGIPGSSGFSMRFDTGPAVIDYLPAVGTAAALDADLFDPQTSNSGQFGGNVLALRLNVDFSDAGDLTGAVNVRFGNLTMCGFSTLAALNGTTIRSFLGTVNTLLGGGSSTYSIAQLDPITIDLNNSFSAGTVSSFAQAHLVNGSCP